MRSPVRCARPPAAGATRREYRLRCASAWLRSPRRRPASSRRPTWRTRSRVLDVSLSEAGRLFGVSRSAVEQWLAARRPAARLGRAANLARIADILERNLKPGRIPAVVREPAEAYGGDVDPRPGPRRPRRRGARAAGAGLRLVAHRLMRHVARGGTYVRVVGPDWADPLDASFSSARAVAGTRRRVRGALPLPGRRDGAGPTRAACSKVSPSRSTTCSPSGCPRSSRRPSRGPLRRRRSVARRWRRSACRRPIRCDGRGSASATSAAGPSALTPGRPASPASRAAAPRPARRRTARSSPSSTGAAALSAAGAAASIAGTGAPDPAAGGGPAYDRAHACGLRSARGTPAARCRPALHPRHPARLDHAAAIHLDDLDDALVRRARVAVGERGDLEPRAHDRAGVVLRRDLRARACAAAWAE